MKKNNGHDYYYIRNKALALAIAFITNEKFYTFNDADKKIYSFKNTDKFRIAFKEIDKLKKEINNN